MKTLCDLDLTFSYVLTDYMQSDLHKIIVSQQPLSPDHIKVFTYQILRGMLIQIKLFIRYGSNTCQIHTITIKYTL